MPRSATLGGFVGAEKYIRYNQRCVLQVKICTGNERRQGPASALQASWNLIPICRPYRARPPAFERLLTFVLITFWDGFRILFCVYWNILICSVEHVSLSLQLMLWIVFELISIRWNKIALMRRTPKEAAAENIPFANVWNPQKIVLVIMLEANIWTYAFRKRRNIRLVTNSIRSYT